MVFTCFASVFEAFRARNPFYNILPLGCEPPLFTTNSATYSLLNITQDTRLNIPYSYSAPEESISHGQQVRSETEDKIFLMWVNETSRVPLTLVHPDFLRQLLQVACSYPTDFDRSGIGKTRTIFSLKPAFEGVSRVSHNQSIKLYLENIFHGLNVCLLWFTIVLF